jgi:hypothetical protein
MVTASAARGLWLHDAVSSELGREALYEARLASDCWERYAVVPPPRVLSFPRGELWTSSSG